jgi:hypothetical protein
MVFCLLVYRHLLGFLLFLALTIDTVRDVPRLEQLFEKASRLVSLYIYIYPTNLVCFEYLSYLQISLHKFCVSQGMMISMTTLMNQHTLIFNKLSSTCKFWFSNSGSIKALESTKWLENEHGRFDNKNL